MRKLVRKTVIIGLIFFLSAIFVQKMRAPVILSGGRVLTMGERASRLEIMLIEDFRCRNCMAFTQKILPQIEHEYIRHGRAKFSLIPVSFLAGSQEISNAVLEVHAQKPSVLFRYIEKVLSLYEKTELKAADLLVAAMSLNLDMTKLEEAIQTGKYNAELSQNLDWALQFMNGEVRTPALYINGQPASTFSFEAIRYQIEGQ